MLLKKKKKVIPVAMERMVRPRFRVSWRGMKIQDKLSL